MLPSVLASLSLAEPWMLGFLAAVALPPLVAWLARPRPRVVGLATVALVIRAARGRGIARRVVDWLPTIARMVMVAVMAVAAAVPGFTPESPTAANEPEEPQAPPLVVVLDGSPGQTASRAVRAAAAACDPDERRWQIRLVDPADEGEAEEACREAAICVASDGVVSRRLRRQLEAMLLGGGGLVVLPSPRPSADAQTLDWLRGVAGIERVERAADSESRPLDSAGLELRLGSEAWLPFEPIPGPRGDVPARLEFRPSPSPGMAASLGTPVPLLRRRADAAVVVAWRGVAAGRIAVSAEPWSVGAARDLVAWPAFVPLVDHTLTAVLPTNPARRPAATAWLARTNLAGLCLLVALVLAAADPMLLLVRGQGGGGSRR